MRRGLRRDRETRRRADDRGGNGCVGRSLAERHHGIALDGRILTSNGYGRAARTQP